MKQFLGRARYRRPDEGERGYRNGYGKPRQLTTRAGTVTVRRPRVRGLEQRFESAWLPLFARRTPEVSDVLPQLYLHRLALGDFELALRGLFGEGAPLAASTVARVKERWHAGTPRRMSSGAGTTASSTCWTRCRSAPRRKRGKAEEDRVRRDAQGG